MICPLSPLTLKASICIYKNKYIKCIFICYLETITQASAYFGLDSRECLFERKKERKKENTFIIIIYLSILE
jgi:hypothetical protein